jgi:hypothetical protein
MKEKQEGRANTKWHQTAEKSEFLGYYTVSVYQVW